jgi:hypothetical protein
MLPSGLVVICTAFAAGNPSGTGLPSQSCQDIEAAGGHGAWQLQFLAGFAV